MGGSKKVQRYADVIYKYSLSLHLCFLFTYMYYNFFVSIKYSKSQQNDHKFVFIVLLLDHFSLTFQPRFEPAVIQNCVASVTNFLSLLCDFRNKKRTVRLVH